MVRSLSALVAASLIAVVCLARPARADEGQEWSARHILVAYQGAMRSTATRSKDEARAAAAKALEAAKAPGADFAAVSHQYSDDKVSDAQGGFLGIFGDGAMAPEFQKAVEGLKDGEITAAPVETPFGFHVIQRLSMAEAVGILGRETAVLTGALFPWAGLKSAQGTSRTKEGALADAQASAKALAEGKRFQDLPPALAASPLFKPQWMPQALRRGMIKADFKILEDKGFALEPGGVSEAFEIPVGYVVLKRTKYFRIHAKHLVVVHAQSPAARGILRTKEEAKARAEEALKKVQADPTSWAKVVAEYSDEPMAGPREGALLVEPGELVGEFEDAVLALAAGATSGVVETAFGYHVIRRLD